MRKLLILLLLASATLAWADAPQRIRPEDIGNTTAGVQARTASESHRATNDVGVRKLIPRIPVIMVQFSDFSFTRTQAEVDSMFNAENYALTRTYEQYNGPQEITTPGSVRKYFEDQSAGQYNPQFDIFGPVTVNHSCCDNFNNNANVAVLVKEACAAMDSTIDFSQYDADNDGKIDLVYIYYAGFGRNDQNYINDSLVSNVKGLIWPHWSVTSGAQYDGKQIRDYECANELDGLWTQSLDDIYPAGIGVAVHEFCHAIGLPDLYPTNGTTNSFRHIGAWDVMDYGCYMNEMHSPCSLSAYERWFLGWLTPTLINSAQDVELGYIGETNEACLITTDGQSLSGPHATTQPYFLLENRQRRRWDDAKVMGADVLGHGLMVTRVEFSSSAWSANTVNNNSSNQRVRLILADNDYSIQPKVNWYAKPTDLYPAGATEYTGITGFPITNITEDGDGVVRFKFMGGTTATPRLQTEYPSPAEKRLVNGRLVIVRGKDVYDLCGRPAGIRKD